MSHATVAASFDGSIADAILLEQPQTCAELQLYMSERWLLVLGLRPAILFDGCCYRAS